MTANFVTIKNIPGQQDSVTLLQSNISRTLTLTHCYIRDRRNITDPYSSDFRRLAESEGAIKATVASIRSNHPAEIDEALIDTIVRHGHDVSDHTLSRIAKLLRGEFGIKFGGRSFTRPDEPLNLKKVSPTFESLENFVVDNSEIGKQYQTILFEFLKLSGKVSTRETTPTQSRAADPSAYLFDLACLHETELIDAFLSLVVRGQINRNREERQVMLDWLFETLAQERSRTAQPTAELVFRESVEAELDAEIKPADLDKETYVLASKYKILPELCREISTQIKAEILRPRLEVVESSLGHLATHAFLRYTDLFLQKQSLFESQLTSIMRLRGRYPELPGITELTEFDIGRNPTGFASPKRLHELSERFDDLRSAFRRFLMAGEDSKWTTSFVSGTLSGIAEVRRLGSKYIDCPYGSWHWSLDIYELLTWLRESVAISPRLKKEEYHNAYRQLTRIFYADKLECLNNGSKGDDFKALNHETSRYGTIYSMRVNRDFRVRFSFAKTQSGLHAVEVRIADFHAGKRG